MNLSDLISFLGILLAITAFIGEKERLFVINKFNKADVVLIIIIFLSVNYLLFYTWWKGVFPKLTNFEDDNLPSPSTWVYLIILLFICWLCYKIFYSKFPKDNQKRVLNYYKQLLQREDFSFLYSVIVKYERNRLLNNNKSQYNYDLIKLIFLSKDFLSKTSNYNYQFFNKILLNNIIEDIVLDNYIESHMRNPSSFIYTSNFNQIELVEFHLLVKKTKRLESLIFYIVTNGIIPLDRLLNFILTFSINKGEVNELYKIILREILYKKDYNSLKLFFIEYLRHLGSNSNIIASFQTITFTLIDFIAEIANVSIFNNILKLYSDITLVLIKVNEEETRKLLLDTFKINRTNNSKILFSGIYEYYYKNHQDASKELEKIFNEIYN